MEKTRGRSSRWSLTRPFPSLKQALRMMIHFKKDTENSDEVFDKKRVIHRIIEIARVNDDDDGHFLDVSADWLYEKMMSMTLQECFDIIAEAVKEHNDDSNKPFDSMIKLDI
ncbi:hypothetical protein V1517DRAFT_376728 [Lipomyces orientalis]|uniref:Uncharacterized protein n=1 Tax=Lipomyces orientalis TaxID=1233043 RepID=A0ACC3TD88_9ASCO